MTLEWSYDEDDPAHSAFITGYLVTAQAVGSGTLLGHAASRCRGKRPLLIILDENVQNMNTHKNRNESLIILCESRSV